MQIRTAAVEAIFTKSLKLKSTADKESISSGQIMNMVSNDVERFMLASLFVFYIIWAPLQALAILIVGWRVIGTAFVAGFALLFLVFVPLQFYLSKRFAVLRSKVNGTGRVYNLSSFFHFLTSDNCDSVPNTMYLGG